MIKLMDVSVETAAKAASFGMAFSPSGVPSSACLPLPEFLSKFDSMEMPVEILELKDAAKHLAGAINGFQYFHAGSVIDPEVAKNLPRSSESLYQEFADYAEKIFPLLAEKGIRTVSFDPGMNAILNDPSSAASVMRLLRMIESAVLRSNIQILLPFSLPYAGKETPDDMVHFLRSSMIPGLKVRLDIHPHKIPPGAMNPDSLAGTLLLEVKSLMIRYDAGAGNFPVAEHILPWVKKLYSIGMHGPFFSAPSGIPFDRFAHEAEIWAEIIKGLRNSQDKIKNPVK